MGTSFASSTAWSNVVVKATTVVLLFSRQAGFDTSGRFLAGITGPRGPPPP
jgi:hypothetical protein